MFSQGSWSFLQHFFFVKKHRANLSPLKFCCVNESFFMFLIGPFCSNISNLCVLFFFLNYSRLQ